MVILTITILLINAPQIHFYTSIIDTETAKNSSICVIFYSHPFWMYLNLVNNCINTILPLLINIFCTTGIMCLIAKQKLLANRKSNSNAPIPTTNIQTALETNEVIVSIENESTHPVRLNIDDIDQTIGWYMKAKVRWNFFQTIIHENIELICGPAITILPQLFCLPQIIISNMIICRDFSSMAIRCPFIISFFISFAPQMFSFLLYVRSSTVYSAHFCSTSIGKKITLYWNFCHRRTEEQFNDSEPSRHVLSNTLQLRE
ncbi:unnamed protein product [Adineta steineri]|uniref:G-protein coupled receptors family 1 profile domain-containing protein n=1 Tax=Adineta steineri TaxID=433720 RepID=A0A814UXA8_9BILA|nr:unnamed protein product [Adineta steineri]CAF1414895.1 unnamed protein product [Adineta steineri]